MLRLAKGQPEERQLIVKRIPEESLIHPVYSSAGLHGLTATFRNCVFVRIVRDPVEVYKSFCAERDEAHPAHDVAIWDDRRILRYIVNERRHFEEYMTNATEEQRRLTDRGGAPLEGWMVIVSYEELDTKEGQLSFAEALNNAIPGIGVRAERDLAKTWKKDIAREGRLSLDIDISIGATTEKRIRKIADHGEPMARMY